MTTPSTIVPFGLQPPPRREGLTAAVAVSRASGFDSTRRRYRVGLKEAHPFFSATYGGVCFHRVSENVTGGARRPVRGQIQELTDEQVRRSKEDAGYKVVRVYGSPDRPVRCDDLDVRSPYVAVQPTDRPVWIDGDPDASLIYFEEDPTDDAEPPLSYEDAIKAGVAKARRSLELPSAGSPGPAPVFTGVTG